MNKNYRFIAVVAVAGMLSGCVSTATNMFDGIAGTVADVGSATLLSVEAGDCGDYEVLASKGTSLDFSEERTFSLVNEKCQEKTGVAIERQTFNEAYAIARTRTCASKRQSESTTQFEICG